MSTRNDVNSRKRGKETRESLINAGLSLMADHGYHRMKVSDIVEKSGVTQASFYWHFRSKQEMVVEVIETGREELVKVIQKGYREEAGTFEDMLNSSENLVVRLISFAKENKDFMFVLLSRGHGAEPKIAEAITKTRKEVYSQLLKNIKRAQDLKMLPEKQNTRLKAFFLHRLIEGAIEWRLFGNEFDVNHNHESDAREFARQLVRLEFFGLTENY